MLYMMSTKAVTVGRGEALGDTVADSSRGNTVGGASYVNGFELQP
jgi:hypothetical protein